MATELSLDRLYPQLSYGRLCYACGKPASQMHHIIGRSNKILRWDYRNIIPVCSYCHQLMHDKNMWNKGYDLSLYKEVLDKYRNMDIKDYLLENGMDMKEFLALKEKELNARILLIK